MTEDTEIIAIALRDFRRGLIDYLAGDPTHGTEYDEREQDAAWLKRVEAELSRRGEPYDT
jgi:hypothetical protein